MSEFVNKEMRLVKSLVLYTIVAFGVSMVVTANLGVGGLNSMNLALVAISHIKIGTGLIFFNMLFLIIDMILTRFRYKKKYVIQIIAITIFGTVVNFFTYQVMSGLIDLNYVRRMMLLVLGTVISGGAVGGIIHYNMLTFPLESMCLSVSYLTKLSFVKLRYSIDIMTIAVSILLSLTNELPFYVREGTVINMVILSFVMNFSRNMFAKAEEVRTESIRKNSLH